jgi:hypothetical protein
MSIEFPPTGGAVPHAQFKPLRLGIYEDDGTGEWDAAGALAEAMVALLVVYYAFRIVQAMAEHGVWRWLAASSWNLAECLNLVLFLAVIAVRLYAADMEYGAFGLVPEPFMLMQDGRTRSEFAPMYRIGDAQDVWRTLQSLCCILSWVRVFR